MPAKWASLKERLNGARTTNQDRGSRMIAYYRLLKEYQTLQGSLGHQNRNRAKDARYGQTAAARAAGQPERTAMDAKLRCGDREESSFK
jgi:hypothetical protein